MKPSPTPNSTLLCGTRLIKIGDIGNKKRVSEQGLPRSKNAQTIRGTIVGREGWYLLTVSDFAAWKIFQSQKPCRHCPVNHACNGTPILCCCCCHSRCNRCTRCTHNVSYAACIRCEAVRRWWSGWRHWRGKQNRIEQLFLERAVGESTQKQHHQKHHQLPNKTLLSEILQLHNISVFSTQCYCSFSLFFLD